MKNVLGKIVLVALLSVVSFGDDMEDASAAYDKKDYKTAIGLYSNACENGYSNGCGMVGFMLENGLGIQKNNQSALSYYAKACEMSNEAACKDSTRLQNEMPVCTQDELSFLNDKRYFDVASSDTNPSIVADAKTIRIDKKNKVIQVWITFISNQKERDSWIQKYGQDYNNYGYYKSLYIINYGNMTYKTNTGTNYNCDGSPIKSFGASEWKSIIPDSVMEGITQSIMKKYHLK